MKHLFLDDRGVELRGGVRRRWHQPQKHGPPVLAPDGALEQPRLHIWNPPLPEDEGEGWRAWYIGGEELNALLARSDDGIHWHRPDLGVVEHDGSRENNLVDLGFDAERKERRLVLCRPGGDARGQPRYVALTRVQGRLKPLDSEDGLRWRFHHHHPGIPSDDEYRLAYDPITGLLIATVKLGGRSGGVRYAAPEFGRAISLSTTPDGIDWTVPEMVFHTDHLDHRAGAEALERHERDEELRSPLFTNPDHTWSDVYNMPVFRYEGLYLGLPIIFHQSGSWQYPGRPEGSNQDGLLWPCLAWSDDLRKWRRPATREAFIPLSPIDDPAIYDNGAIHACAPVRRGDELWFYYYGSRFSHVSVPVIQKAGLFDEGLPTGAVFLAKLRLDGFASLSAEEAPGAVLTRPITVDGGTLRINARTRDGEVRVEIRDAESGRAIEGFSIGDALASRTIDFPDGTVHHRGGAWGARFEDDPEGDDSVPFSGDAVDATVRWRNGADLSELRGREVRLLFALRNADLYAFEFVDQKT